MNELEKRSFYSFLSLYIVSSFMFIAGIGYWYYIAQKNALENEMYYTLQHIADMKSGDIIMAHMNHTSMKKLKLPSDVTLALINTKGEVVEGSLYHDSIDKKEGYISLEDYKILISAAPRKHLDISFVVVQSNRLSQNITSLKGSILQVLAIVSLLIVLVAVILSKLFMRPVRQRVEQIERFINDVTHELNTPITSLSMATDQVLKQREYSPKMMKNISISTKQLYDIYRSLTYLNFSTKKEVLAPLDIKEILQKSIAYYSPLAEVKRIGFEVELESTVIPIPEAQASLLFGNLIGNAIKYSSPNSTITIILSTKILTIKDEGIGIETNKQKEIFKKFKRGTQYSGGFGVGLSIVKSICVEYDIAITLDSTVDKGTTFVIDFTTIPTK